MQLGTSRRKHGEKHIHPRNAKSTNPNGLTIRRQNTQ